MVIDSTGGANLGEICYGIGNEVLITYSAFAGYPYCNRRVFGKIIRYKEGDILPVSNLICYPAVSDGRFMMKVLGWEQGEVNIKVYDVIGREIKEFNEYINEGINEIPLNFSNLNNGKYFLYIRNNNDKMVKPFIVLR